MLLTTHAGCATPSANAGGSAAKIPDDSQNRDDSGRKKKTKQAAQSYEEAWQLICDAERRSGSLKSKSRQERGEIVAGWIAEHIRNKQARYWWVAYGSVKPEERQRLFMRDAQAAGVKGCALATLLFAPSSQPVVPHSRPAAAAPQGATADPTPPPPATSTPRREHRRSDKLSSHKPG